MIFPIIFSCDVDFALSDLEPIARKLVNSPQMESEENRTKIVSSEPLKPR